MSEVSERLKGIIARQLEIKEERVTENAMIVDDLGADSLDIIEIVSILEEKFDIEIPDDRSNKITTVGALVSYIDGKIIRK
ncbi:MAG: acyl carrier protein [Candidatus Omnitrophota bacterium]